MAPSAPTPDHRPGPLFQGGVSQVSTPRTPPKVPRPEPAPIASSPAIAAVRGRLDAAPAGTAGDAARRAVVAEFWAAHPRTPLLESLEPSGTLGLSDTLGASGALDSSDTFSASGTLAGSETADERIVTFLWRDDAGEPAEAVLLFANRITDERNLDASLMQRVPGTDIWHLSYRMRDDWRASYSFHVRRSGEAWPWSPDDQLSVRQGLDRGQADPRNPLTCRNRPGALMSVVELPAAPPQPWLVRREGLAARGRVSKLLGPGRRPVWLYTPPRIPLPPITDPTAHPVLSRPVRTPEPPMPVIVLFDGEVWAGTQSIADTVDNLIADGLIRPCIVVMPAAGDRERRWADLDDDGAGGDWVVNELLPWVRSIAPASLQPSEVVVAGQSLGGYTALRCALEHPEAVGAVLSQSASLWQRELRARAPELVHRLHVYMEVGTQEWVLREPNRELAAAFVAAGADVHFTEYNGGHDYACWRGGIADGIRALIGPPARPADRGEL